jgi:Flp pilus assembly protein TadD
MPQQSVLDGPAPARQTAPVPTVSRPVVQPVPAQSESGAQAGRQPDRRSQALNAALARLARDPRNVEALLDAGTAAMALGDMDAALGFLRRADEIAPGNGQVKAQMGKALVRAKDPLGAIRAFDEAQRGGANPADFAADRGLALDLVGDNFLAQQYYRQSLARSNDAEVTRRLALSLAISGNRNEAEKSSRRNWPGPTVRRGVCAHSFWRSAAMPIRR